MTNPHKIKLTVLGAATSPHTLARTLIFHDMGYDVTLISPTPCPDDLPIKTYYTGNNRRIIGRLLSLIKCFIALHNSKGDLIHAHYAAEYGTWIAALFTRKPLVITVMGGDVLFEEQGNLSSFSQFLTKVSLRYAKFITAKSHRLAKKLIEFKVNPDNIHVVYWGIKPSLFFPSPSQKNIFREDLKVDDRTIVCYCPRMLQPLYNQDIIIHSFAQFHKKHSNSCLLLSTFGKDSAYEQKILALIQHYCLKHAIILLPPMEPLKMAKAYNAADILISVPSSDGMPQSILEAMACKTPTIVSDLSHYQELLSHNQNTIMTSITIDGIASAMETLYNDSNLRETITESAYTMVHKTCRLDREAERVHDLFIQLKNEG